MKNKIRTGPKNRLYSLIAILKTDCIYKNILFYLLIALQYHQFIP